MCRSEPRPPGRGLSGPPLAWRVLLSAGCSGTTRRPYKRYITKTRKGENTSRIAGGWRMLPGIGGRRPVFGPQQSAFSIQLSAIRRQRSAFSGQLPAISRQRSAFSAQLSGGSVRQTACRRADGGRRPRRLGAAFARNARTGEVQLRRTALGFLDWGRRNGRGGRGHGGRSAGRACGPTGEPQRPVPRSADTGGDGLVARRRPAWIQDPQRSSRPCATTTSTRPG